MGGFWQEKALSKHLKKNHSSSQGIYFFPCSLLFQHVGRSSKYSVPDNSTV